MRTTFTILFLAILLPFGAAAQKPNVLFIAIDDMNDWIGPLGGHPQAVTPNLDRLAKMGVMFTNAHTVSAACHSSRVAIMTGVRPTTSGLTANVFAGVGPTWRKNPKLKDVVTLSQHFRDNGYTAMGGGKIYHSLQWWPGSENDPETWDSYFPEPHKPIPFQVRPLKAAVQRHEASCFGRRPLGDHLFGWLPVAEDDDGMSDYKVVEWAVAEMKEIHEKPFFIAAGIFRPHIPWEVPKKYFDMYPLETVKLPAHQIDDLVDTMDHGRRHWHQWVVQNGQWKPAVQGYLASISFADAMVGRLLDGLEASGHAKNTIIVLWSDHGMHIGEKENWEKFTCWEESTRIPMFVVAPGVITPGRVCSRPVTTLDVYPTLAELAGTTLPPQLEGESLVPLLRDPMNGKREQPAISSYRKTHGVRTDHWRYIFDVAQKMEELYDHRVDPGEHDNVAFVAANRKVLDEHRALLRKYTAVDVPEGEPVVTPAFDKLANEHVRRSRYVTMAEAVKMAKAARAAGEPIPTLGVKRKLIKKPLRRIPPEKEKTLTFGAGQPVTLQFHNNRKAPVVTWWINEDRRRVRYKEIAAGESVNQGTYAGHHWLVTDADGTVLGIYKALAGDAAVVVE